MPDLIENLLTPTTVPMPSRWDWLCAQARRMVPVELEEVIAWADANYRVMSNDGEYFDSTRSPWLIEPLRMADDPLVHDLSFAKPIQIGGTSLGEIILMRRILDSHGIIHYNWPTDIKAEDRWSKFTEKRLKACHAIRALLPGNYEKCLIKFPNITLAMQGVFTSGNLDSDTVDFILNEEVHQWEAGMLGKAKGRQTRVAFPKFINISNSSLKGDQFHQAVTDGTQQHYENRCPGCGKRHRMRTRWEDNRPDLGGLRYDSQGCKRDDGTFDYNRLIPSIFYQFPTGSPLKHPDHDFCHCGYQLRDDLNLRRQAAQLGRYSDPQNTGALLTNRSYTLQAVACHDIRWLDLIMEKHQALRALRAGKDDDWRRYLQERESVFYDASEHRPFQGSVVLTRGAQRNRKGLADEAAKLFAFDWQQGFKHLGELTHYWGVIESVRADCSSQVIWSGKVDDEQEMLTVLGEHGITAEDGGGIFDGFIDASKNTKHILSFCYRAGINAVRGGDQGKGGWKWPDGSWQYYSMKKFIYKELNIPPKYELHPTKDGWVEDAAEPFIIQYNKAGLLANHFFIREMKANVLAHNPDAGPSDYVERVVPADIGEDYLKHHEAWERDLQATGPKKMVEVEGFKKVARADHLLSCTCYIDLRKDLEGLLGAALHRLGIAPPKAREET